MSTPGRPEGTRGLILETALRLFRETGYEATTMRAVAAEAGVAVGAAYYWFHSKEHLVGAMYDRTVAEHRAVAEPLLAGRPDFADRLQVVMATRVQTLQPYKEFAGAFFRYAADPDSPLSPFGAEAGPAREAGTALYALVVEGSEPEIAPDLRRELPELLWMYGMAVVLHWVHDPSPDAARTMLVVERSVPLVARVVSLAELPLLRPALDDVLGLLEALRAPGPEQPGR